MVDLVAASDFRSTAPIILIEQLAHCAVELLAFPATKAQADKCGRCGGKRVDVRPNWKEKPGMPDDWQARSA
jgi:hypothetical protein